MSHPSRLMRLGMTDHRCRPRTVPRRPSCDCTGRQIACRRGSTPTTDAGQRSGVATHPGATARGPPRATQTAAKLRNTGTTRNARCVPTTSASAPSTNGPTPTANPTASDARVAARSHSTRPTIAGSAAELSQTRRSRPRDRVAFPAGSDAGDPHLARPPRDGPADVLVLAQQLDRRPEPVEHVAVDARLQIDRPRVPVATEAARRLSFRGRAASEPAPRQPLEMAASAGYAASSMRPANSSSGSCRPDTFQSTSHRVS